ncbi:MAG: hypothetical protein J6B00_03995 [Alphaproteobacteria bacterium]|nr:hypothetical protein [Alphaproteobacteria bacterium]
MYLLMLLATFVSAIYGYNLSARADYERDIARKRAAGVVYRFLFHTKTVAELVSRVDSEYRDNDQLGFIGVQPNDLIYADFNASGVPGDNKGTSLAYQQGDSKGTSLAYQQGDSNTKYFLLRRKNNNGGDNPGVYNGIEAKDWMLLGRKLYDKSEMVTKVVCMDASKAMFESGATQCTSHTDEGHLIDSCCSGNKERYLVSYRNFDVRFINRITYKINMDFWNAINERAFLDNIGIIYWEGGKWKFNGRLNFPPAFEEEKRAYEEAHKNDANPDTRYFPGAYKKKTYWELPTTIFKEGFFKGVDGANMCHNSGCLMQIKYF